MTLIKGNRAGLSSLGPNTTIYGEESLIENGEIEEMHYLMVKVERMKKQMLGKVEGRIDLKTNTDKSAPIDELDRKEEMLYRNSDVIEVGGNGTFTKVGDELSVGNRIGLNFSAEMSVENQGGNINGSFV